MTFLGIDVPYGPDDDVVVGQSELAPGSLPRPIARSETIGVNGREEDKQPIVEVESTWMSRRHRSAGTQDRAREGPNHRHDGIPQRPWRACVHDLPDNWCGARSGRYGRLDVDQSAEHDCIRMEFLEDAPETRHVGHKAPQHSELQPEVGLGPEPPQLDLEHFHSR